jgi:hypothetical protein
MNKGFKVTIGSRPSRSVMTVYVETYDEIEALQRAMHLMSRKYPDRLEQLRFTVEECSLDEYMR